MPRPVLLISLAGAAIAYLIMAFAPELRMLVIGRNRSPLVDADNQGRLQGVLASIVSLDSVVGALFFSTVYFGLSPGCPGAVWLVGCAVYALALPLMFGLRRRGSAAMPPEARQS